jgi:hypothetical protein
MPRLEVVSTKPQSRQGVSEKAEISALYSKGSPNTVPALECAGVCLSWSQTWSQTQRDENSTMGNCLK